MLCFEDDYGLCGYAQLTTAIARMLQRPEMESKLLHHWRDRPNVFSTSPSDHELMRDVYEGDVFRRFSKVLDLNDEYI